MTKRTVKIRNIKTGEERHAYLNADEDAVVNEKGVEYDHKYWQLIMPSPGFLFFTFALFATAVFLVVFAIVGSAK